MNWLASVYRAASKRKRASRIYEITSVDTGKTFRWSEQKARAYFGAAEWKEIKAGYLPHIVVVDVTDGARSRRRHTSAHPRRHNHA